MDKSGFRRLFWGFLFAMLDFRIMGVDILPDIIGYFFFLQGLNLLVHKDEYFKNAVKYCIPLIILSIFSLYDTPREVGQTLSGFAGIEVIIGIAATVLDLILVFNICKGIECLAHHEGISYLAQEAESRWKQYLGFFIASISMFILIIIPPLLIIGLIALIVYAIVLIFLMTGFMTRCREAFENNTL